METIMTVAIPFASLTFPKLRLPLFEDDRFQATKFNTGADKAKFANHFLRFMSKGFPEQTARDGKLMFSVLRNLRTSREHAFAPKG